MGKGTHHNVEVREFLKILELHSGGPVEIVGGFEMLIQKLSVGVDIRVGCNVTKIIDGPQVTVECGTEKLTADAVVFACTAPQKIAFEPALNAAHAAALEKLRAGCNP